MHFGSKVYVCSVVCECIATVSFIHSINVKLLSATMSQVPFDYHYGQQRAG